MNNKAPMLRLLGFLVATALLVVRPAEGSSILINGSFELTTPDIPGSGELLAGSTQIIGWTVTGSSTANDVIDWLGPGGGGPLWLASDGTHLVDLDGRDSLNGGIYQTFATIVGQQYNVSFDLSGNPGDAPTNGLPRIKLVRVAVDGFTRDYEFDSTGLTTTTLVWLPISFSFVASSTTAALSFTSLTPFPNSYGPLIDDVSVTSGDVATPVPETGPGVLLTTGLIVLLVRQRTRMSRGRRNSRRIVNGTAPYSALNRQLPGRLLGPVRHLEQTS